ncbi:hypothetical protein VTI74DRAFT_5876 [Chaetomium olivicolor]
MQRFREQNIETARGRRLPQWAPEGSLGLVKEDEGQAGPVCREINEYTAKLRDELGCLATLPPMDSLDACMKEIRYVFDTLKADCVVVFSSYRKRYLGPPICGPDQLDARETTCTACRLITTGITPDFPDVKIILSH